jgi:hypothetical protein
MALRHALSRKSKPTSVARPESPDESRRPQLLVFYRWHLGRGVAIWSSPRHGAGVTRPRRCSRRKRPTLDKGPGQHCGISAHGKKLLENAIARLGAAATTSRATRHSGRTGYPFAAENLLSRAIDLYCSGMVRITAGFGALSLQEFAWGAWPTTNSSK